MPDLWLPSQPQGITVHWVVPNYTAWWQRHMCVNNLPWQGCTQQWAGQDLNPWAVNHKSSVLTTRPPSHTDYHGNENKCYGTLTRMYKKCRNKDAFYCNAAIDVHPVPVPKRICLWISLLWRCKVIYQLWYSGYILIKYPLTYVPGMMGRIFYRDWRGWRQIYVPL